MIKVALLFGCKMVQRISIDVNHHKVAVVKWGEQILLRMREEAIHQGKWQQ